MGEPIKVIPRDGKEVSLELVTAREVSERGLVPSVDGLIVVHRSNGNGTGSDERASGKYDFRAYNVPNDAVAMMTGGIVLNPSGGYQPYHFFTKGRPQTSETAPVK